MVRTFEDPAARTAPIASRRIASLSAPLMAVLAGLLAWSVSPVLADAVPFEPPELLSVTDDVEALVPADINGDGRTDLVVAESRSISTGELLWLENTIAGWVRHSIALSDLLGDVAVGDIDGDGTLDIVASSPEVSAVRWFANDSGDGSTWTSRAVAGSVAGVEGIEVADLDRDGRLDVVGALSGVDEVRFWRQTPAGLWQERLIGTGATGIRDIALGDVDVDGRIDVVGLVPGAGQIRGWINPDDLNTATSWGQRFIGVADDPVGLEVVDFDHDGAPDVLAASRSFGIVGFWRNDGAGTGGNWQRNNLATVDQPVALQVLDLDRDGDLDVVVSSGQAGGGVLGLDNQGDDGYTLRSLATGIQGAALAALDLEPDGDPDLVLGDVEAWQLENRSPAVGARFGFADQVFAPLLAGSSIQPAVRIGRINDDARPDILVTGVTPPEVSGATALLNFAGPLYGLSILPPFEFSLWPGNVLPPRLTAPAIGDFDRDGRNELLFGSNDNAADLTTMGVCANSAPRYEDFPVWDCRELFAEDSAGNDVNASISGGVFSADIDRDGWPDLVAATQDWLPFGNGVRRLQWFEHLGDFSSSQPFQANEIATGTFSVVGLADLNRDGRTDIVTSGSLFRNSADDGSLWNEQTPLPFGWTFVDIGDVDRDGGPDLLVDAGSGLHWARRDGPDWPTFEIDPDAGCPCSFADIDADGDLDVVAVDGDGAPVLLRNTFSPGGSVGWSSEPAFPDWTLPVDAIYALDFSDDGLPELIVRSESTEYFFTNQASTLNAEWTAVPPAILVEEDAELVFELDLVHAGRAGDPDIAVTELRFQLSSSSDDGALALTNVELDAVVAHLAVYRDDGDGLFDAGDELIAESLGGPFSDETIVLDAGAVRPATTVACCDSPQRLFVEFTAASGAEAVVDPVFLRPAVIEAVDVIEQGAVRVQAPPALRAAELDLAAPVPGEEWLSVRVFGDGSVASSPIGIQCDADGGAGCSERFASGATVSLMPVPPTGQLFAGWEGDCSGLGSCDLVMDATKSAMARFEPEGEGTVNVTIIGGGGRVTSDPPRILCPDACAANFNVGSEVTLTATPDPGFEFDAWVTAAFCPDTQSPTCTFTVGPLQTITLSFVPAPDPERSLTVAVNGQGRVTSSPAGIDCGPTCVADFPTNERVLLTAIPESGWRFDNWGDACSGPDPNCLIELAQDTTVQPRFVPEPVMHRVTVSVVGGGQVQSTPSGIDCPSTCSIEFEEGTSLLLEQQAAPGFAFAGWTSSVNCGTVACAFTVDGPIEVEALFVSSAPQVTLDVTVVGSGRVTSQPAGIDCPGDCSASFDENTVVDLFAVPEPGFEFLGWNGACSGTGSCTVTLDAMRQVEASFASIQPRFDLDVVRIGNGFVGSTPGGIQCGTSCTASFEQGTEVELVAAPSSGWRFSHWDGDCIGVGACMVTLDGPRQVEAVFVQRFELTVDLDGSGAVISDPVGIDCGTQCGADFDAGTLVSLTATPDPGWVVAAWIGASCPVGPACTLVVDANRNVTVRFEPVTDLVFRDGFE